MASQPHVIVHVIHEVTGASEPASHPQYLPPGMGSAVPMRPANLSMQPGAGMHAGCAPMPMYPGAHPGAMGYVPAYMEPENGFCAPQMGFAPPMMMAARHHPYGPGPMPHPFPPGPQAMCCMGPGQQMLSCDPGAYGSGPFMQPMPQMPIHASMGFGGPDLGGQALRGAIHKGQRGKAAKHKSATALLRRTRNAERQGQIQSLVGKLAAEINGNVQGKATEPLSEGAGSGSEAAH